MTPQVIRKKKDAKEKWLDIVGFEASHQISNKGRVRSKERLVRLYNTRYKQYQTIKLKSEMITGSIVRKYRHICLKYMGKRMNGYNHRLVAKAFIPNPKNLAEVDHIDRNKLNNHASNLRWCTSSENKWNMNKQNNKSSKFMGVSYHKVPNNWRAFICIN